MSDRRARLDKAQELLKGPVKTLETGTAAPQRVSVPATPATEGIRGEPAQAPAAKPPAQKPSAPAPASDSFVLPAPKVPLPKAPAPKPRAAAAPEMRAPSPVKVAAPTQPPPFRKTDDSGGGTDELPTLTFDRSTGPLVTGSDTSSREMPNLSSGTVERAIAKVIQPDPAPVEAPRGALGLDVFDNVSGPSPAVALTLPKPKVPRPTKVKAPKEPGKPLNLKAHAFELTAAACCVALSVTALLSSSTAAFLGSALVPLVVAVDAVAAGLIAWSAYDTRKNITAEAEKNTPKVI